MTDGRLILNKDIILETVTLTLGEQTCNYSDIEIDITNQEINLSGWDNCPLLRSLLANNNQDVTVSYMIQTTQAGSYQST